MLTPQSVIPNAAPADDELVIVVCKDEKGNVFNHYIRDAALKASLVAVDDAAAQERTILDVTLAATRTAAHAVVLARATTEIAAAAELKMAPVEE